MENNNLSGEKKPEMITDKNGNVNYIDWGKDMSLKKQIEIINQSSSEIAKATPTVIEVSKRLKEFSLALSKHKSIFNTKASN